MNTEYIEELESSKYITHIHYTYNESIIATNFLTLESDINVEKLG